MTDHADGVSAPAVAQVALTNAALRLWQRTGAPLLLPVTGTSMLPLLRPGNQIAVTSGRHLYPIGTIIVFQQAGQLVVHRVVRRLDGGRWLTKGDNGPVDAPVCAADIVGVVTAIYQGGRRLALDAWWWRLWGWLLAYRLLHPAIQRRVLRLVAGKRARLTQR